MDHFKNQDLLLEMKAFIDEADKDAEATIIADRLWVMAPVLILDTLDADGTPRIGTGLKSINNMGVVSDYGPYSSRTKAMVMMSAEIANLKAMEEYREDHPGELAERDE